MAAYYIFTVLIFIVCILLILIVLVQNSKGGGLASNFSSSNQIMGVRKTADFLEKGTWVLAIALLALSLMTVFVIPRHSGKTQDSELKGQIKNTPMAPTAMPTQGGQNGQAQPAQAQPEATTPTK